MWRRLPRNITANFHRPCLVTAVTAAPSLPFGSFLNFVCRRSFASSKMSAATAAGAAASSTSSFNYFPDGYDHHHLLDKAKLLCADLVLAALPTAFPAANATVLTAARTEIANKMTKPSQKGRGELSLPCFIFNKKFDPAFTLPPPAFAPVLSQHVATLLTADSGSAVVKVEAAGPYINFYLTSGYLASVVPVILDKSFLTPLPRVKQQRVMIEYSQVSHTLSHPQYVSSAASPTLTTSVAKCATHTLLCCIC